MMLTSDIVKLLTEQLTARYPQLTEHAIRESVQVMMGHIIEALGQGERLEIRGFGSFFTQQMAARQARNPKTGAIKILPPHSRLRFRAAKQLLLRINARQHKKTAVGEY